MSIYVGPLFLASCQTDFAAPPGSPSELARQGFGFLFTWETGFQRYYCLNYAWVNVFNVTKLYSIIFIIIQPYEDYIFYFISFNIFHSISSTPAYITAFGARADTVPAFFIVTALDGRSVLRNDTRDIFASLVKKVNI